MPREQRQQRQQRLSSVGLGPKRRRSVSIGEDHQCTDIPEYRGPWSQQADDDYYNDPMHEDELLAADSPFTPQEETSRDIARSVCRKLTQGAMLPRVDAVFCYAVADEDDEAVMRPLLETGLLSRSSYVHGRSRSPMSMSPRCEAPTAGIMLACERDDAEDDGGDGSEQDDTWVQCDACEKWRRVEVAPSDDGEWTCQMAGLGCEVPEETWEDSDAGGAAKGRGRRAKRGSKGGDAAQLQALVDFVTENGGESDIVDGWHVITEVRAGGATAGTKDSYFISSTGKRFRSKAEVGRYLGILLPSSKRAKSQAASH